MYVLFYVCRVIDFVDWLDKWLIIYEKCLEMCICLWPEFDCPEGTLCGWQDIKMQLLTDWTGLWAILYIMGSQRGPVCGRSCTSWAANVDRFVGNPVHHGQSSRFYSSGFDVCIHSATTPPLFPLDDWGHVRYPLNLIPNKRCVV